MTELSDADRDRYADALARHAAAGRLTVEQHEARVGRVLRAATREEAVAALDGLPPLQDPEAPRRRGRGHGEADAPGAGWTPTNERFRDPGSGRIMRVWVDPVDGSRHYVAD